MNGKVLGVCKKCRVVSTAYKYPQYKNSDPRDWYLEDLLAAWDDMNGGGRSPASSVINLSWGSDSKFWTPAFLRKLYNILKRMDSAGVTVNCLLDFPNGGDLKDVCNKGLNIAT
ncbi:hypothetical protein GGS20DRAFT_591108 [Poronia punctata]|nr:hypothetical protein GGS20DRAFT_591108 [Poronia punctata]